MDKLAWFVIGLFVGIVAVAFVGILINGEQAKSALETQAVSFDPNDPMYKFVVLPNAEWTKQYGTSERSVVFYNLSLARGAINLMTQRLQKLEVTPDANNVGK